MGRNQVIRAFMLIVGLLLLSYLPLAAQEGTTTIARAERFAVSPPLRELAKLPQPPQYGFHEANPVRRIPKPSVEPVVDTVLQSTAGVGANYSLLAHTIGVGNGFPGYRVPGAPSDTNMAVGDTQVVQWVVISYTICDKTPGNCSAAILGNKIWSALGGACADHNDGDPIVQYDRAAHRWIFSQADFDSENNYEPPYHVCLAVSTSPDAAGSYYLYQFPVVNDGFPDYPKWGVWPTGYFQTWNNFGPKLSGFVGPVLCAYNSAKLLVGDNTAEQICHQYSKLEDSLLPADRDSPTAPPSGQDEFAIGNVVGGYNSHVSLYSVHINNQNDWTQGATFTGDHNSQLLTIANFTPSCNGSYGGACVPQKGITDKSDSLGDRLMYRFAYWEDPPMVSVKATPPKPLPSQHWYVNFDVFANPNIGPRWIEITAPIKKVAPADLSVFQQGTYAPDGNWRWMGSIARDNVDDVLLGYSESCGDTCPGGTPTYPSIAVAGRTSSDPIGTLESELLYINGTGSQIGTSNRWGDYSAMRIDPVDNCTFWYTTEYYMLTASFNWSTDIAKLSFSNCK